MMLRSSHASVATEAGPALGGDPETTVDVGHGGDPPPRV